MSMMAGFRQVTPELLERLRAEPDLVEDVVMGQVGGAPVVLADVEAFVQSLPGDLRATIEAMPPEMRAAWNVQAEQTLASLPPALRGDSAVSASAPGGVEADASDVEGLGPELSIEKAWHGVHWLLCGTPMEAPPPLGDVILGGDELGDDVGYGPARVLDAVRTAAVAAALEGLPAEDVADRFDAVRLDADEIYPSGWDEQGRREWLVAEYARVRDFYLGAAAEGRSVVLWLN
jgi:hypothetical protein